MHRLLKGIIVLLLVQIMGIGFLLALADALQPVGISSSVRATAFSHYRLRPHCLPRGECDHDY